MAANSNYLPGILTYFICKPYIMNVSSGHSCTSARWTF